MLQAVQALCWQACCAALLASACSTMLVQGPAHLHERLLRRNGTAQDLVCDGRQHSRDVCTAPHSRGPFDQGERCT